MGIGSEGAPAALVAAAPPSVAEGAPATGQDGLFGGDSADTLIGGGGVDYLVSGNGADTFLFQPNFGFDTIADFNAVEDVINLASVGTYTFDEVMARTTQSGSNSIIDLGGGNIITLVDIFKVNFVPDDFAL